MDEIKDCFSGQNSHYEFMFGVSAMKSMSAKDAKNTFGLLLDKAPAAPVIVEKHCRTVVVVICVEYSP